MLLSGWVALTGVERWAERAPWPDAVLSGLMWSCVVAGVWWFAEWTQAPLRTARQAAAERARRGRVPLARNPAAGTPAEGSTGASTAPAAPSEEPADRGAGASTPV
ncbi:hypothetical protein ABZ172_02405 [Streptomyces sp. NPDC006296]|uniref:hypothetical protein n=1 Tax=Streptomyces sp. NPDC006296 TaxID=3156746 RepID=UPI0033BF4827